MSKIQKEKVIEITFKQKLNSIFILLESIFRKIEALGIHFQKIFDFQKALL